MQTVPFERAWQDTVRFIGGVDAEHSHHDFLIGSQKRGLTMAIDGEKIAFEMFADVYPHEAAEADWQAFVAYTQSKNPAIPEEEIRRLLKETA
jgi:hypothetical protein